jgi:predicted SnoaL-like aldol condensation-catalyzing enzyme
VRNNASAQLEIIAEDNLVLVHTNLVQEPGTEGPAVAYILRVQDGRIAEEHRDLRYCTAG